MRHSEADKQEDGDIGDISHSSWVSGRRHARRCVVRTLRHRGLLKRRGRRVVHALPSLLHAWRRRRISPCFLFSTLPENARKLSAMWAGKRGRHSSVFSSAVTHRCTRIHVCVRACVKRYIDFRCRWPPPLCSESAGGGIISVAKSRRRLPPRASVLRCAVSLCLVPYQSAGGSDVRKCRTRSKIQMLLRHSMRG